jgi:hypothetical protein
MRSISSTISIPDPTPFLFLSATIAACLLLTERVTPEGMALAIVALTPAFVGVINILSTRPDVAAALLIAAAVAPRFYAEIGGLKARPEHIVVGLMCLVLPVYLRRHPTAIKWMLADYMVVGYIALNILSSVFLSTAPVQTVKWAMQQTLVILPYFFLRALVADWNHFRKVVGFLLAVGAAEAAYAIVCFYSHVFFGTKFGMMVDQYGNIPGTYGTQFEANILGSYSGACAVMMMAMYLEGRKGKYLAGYGLALSAAAISLSRAAVGATIIGLFLLFFYSRMRRRINWPVLRAAGVTTLCVVLALTPALVGMYRERFGSLAVADSGIDENTMTRVIQIALALENYLVHPIFGNGTSSFQLAFNWADIDSGDEAGWIGNTEIRVLHDTGAVGIAVFGLFIALLAIGAWKILKRRFDPALEALFFSAIVFFIAFQLTEGTLLAFSWVHMGLIGCALSLYQASQAPGLSRNASPETRA